MRDEMRRERERERERELIFNGQLSGGGGCGGGRRDSIHSFH